MIVKTAGRGVRDARDRRTLPRPRTVRPRMYARIGRPQLVTAYTRATKRGPSVRTPRVSSLPSRHRWYRQQPEPRGPLYRPLLERRRYDQQHVSLLLAKLRWLGRVILYTMDTSSISRVNCAVWAERTVGSTALLNGRSGLVAASTRRCGQNRWSGTPYEGELRLVVVARRTAHGGPAASLRVAVSTSPSNRREAPVRRV